MKPYWFVLFRLIVFSISAASALVHAHGGGLEGTSVVVPTLPECTERQRRSVLKRQEEWSFAVPGPLPLEPPVGWHHAPT